MAKDEVVKDEAGKDKMPKNKLWNSNLFIGLTCAVVGAMAAALFIHYNDYRRDNQAREDLKKIISYDINNTTSTLDEFLKVTTRAEMIEKSNNPEWAPYISNYDTSVFDAYIHKISLLPENSARRILLFYKNLRTINGDKYLLQNKGSNMPSKERKAWTNHIYDAIDKTAKVGKEIITVDNKLNTTEPNDFYYGRMDAASSTSHIVE